MANLYVDVVSGNDSNDGTTFANRKKTIASALTVASDGDTIRVKESPAPVSTGLTVTLTKGSGTIALPAGTCLLLTNCETAWTASANVTCTAVGAPLASGTYCARNQLASAFTTGKAAYIDLGSSIDCSGYQIVNFTVNIESGTVGASMVGAYKIQLCSDASGNTPIAGMDIPIPRINSTATSFAVVWDYGAALPNNVRSIRLYVNTDLGGAYITVDNFFCSKAASSADSITLYHLLGGPNAPGAGGNDSTHWYTIQAIDGDSVYLERIPCRNRMSYAFSASSPVYDDPTESSVTLYKRSPVTYGFGVGAETLLSKSGLTTGILLSAGWNSTDMSTQSGYTFIRPDYDWAYGLYLNSDGFSLERWGVIGYSTAIFSGAGGIVSISDNCYYSASYAEYGAYRLSTSENSFFQACNNGIRTLSFTTSTVFGTSISGHRFVSCPSNAINAVGVTKIANCRIAYPLATVGFTGINGIASSILIEDTEIELLAASTWQTAVFSGGHVVLRRCTIIGGTTYNAAFAVASAEVYDSTISGMERMFTNMGSQRLCFYGVDIDSVTNMMTYSSEYNRDPSAFIKVQNYGKVFDDHRIFTPFGNITSETTTRRTASGLAWKIAPTVNDPRLTLLGGVSTPITFPVVTGSQTVKLWMRRSNTGLTAGFRVHGGVIEDVDSDSVTMTASADTWEELSLTINPTTAGILTIEVFAYGGTTYSAFFDDLTVNGVSHSLDLFSDRPASPHPVGGGGGARLVGPSALVSA